MNKDDIKIGDYLILNDFEGPRVVKVTGFNELDTDIIEVRIGLERGVTEVNIDELSTI